jgi:protein-ribulosamine 3-kinase
MDYSSVSVHLHGISLGAKTARRALHSSMGSTSNLFVKVCERPVEHDMLLGEFEGSKTLFELNPRHVPRLIGWGTFSSDPGSMALYTCEFIKIKKIEHLDDIQRFCTQLGAMPPY